MKRFLSVLIILSIAFMLNADVLSVKYDKTALYDAMMKNNTSLRTADADIYEASLDVKDANAKYQPSVDLTISGTYMVEPPIGNITMSSDEIFSSSGTQTVPGAQNGAYVTLFDGMDNTLYNASLTVTQPVNTWGKINLASDLYKTVESLQGIKKSDLERQLSAELSTRLDVFAYLDGISELLEKAKEISSYLLSILEKSYKSGVIVESEYLEAKVMSMELDLRASELNMEKESNFQTIKTLVGISTLKYEDIVFEVDDSPLYIYANASYEELKSYALSSSNLSLQMINKLKSVHEIQEKIANRSMYGIPDMAIQVSAQYNTSRLPLAEAGWRQNDNFSLNITFAMQTTLWDGGEKISDKARAESAQNRDSISYDEALLSIESVLNENYLGMQNTLVKLDYYNLKESNLELLLSNAKLAEQYGQKGKADILQCELDIIENSIEIYMAKLGLASNVYILGYLVGDNI